MRGRQAVLLGGDPREPNRERLQRAFEFASLERPAIDGPRKVDSVVGRIRKGTYGLVLVLQPFVAHKESEPIQPVATVVYGDFEWDDGKAASNVAKHGVTFEEAAHALAGDPNALDLSDPIDPSRVDTLAMSPLARILYVVSMEVGPHLRIISARRATSHERRIYTDGS